MFLEPDTASNLKEPFDCQINYRRLDFRVLTRPYWLWGEYLHGMARGETPYAGTWGQW